MSSLSSPSSPTVSVTAKWQSSSLTFSFPLSATVAELHSHVAQLFQLSPSLKLIGLVKGRLPDPSATLASLSLPPELRLLVVGVRAEAVSELRDIDIAFTLQAQEDERRELKSRHQREVTAVLEAERLQEAQDRQRERQAEYERQRAERERLWREEEAQREQERRERELREEQAGGDVSLTLSCLLSPQAEAKGKLILPPSALQRIVDAKVAFPLTFAVRRAAREGVQEEEEKKEDSGDAAAEAAEKESREAVVYLGVADFDSPHASVVLVPASVLTTLGIAEGGSVSLTTVTLPKATHITLLPLPVASSASSAPRPSPFLSLSPPERAALLEFHLRRHQMLQRGQIIDVAYRSGLQTMRFEVRDTQPADVVSIVDSDVVTDVEGLDGQQETEREVKVQELRLDDEVQAQLQHSHYSQWSAALDDANAAYELTVRSLQGDADVYAVMQDATSLLPDDSFWQWRGVEPGDDRLLLSSDDPAFRAGQLSIAVHAYEADCVYKISLRKVPQPAPAAASTSSSSLPAADTTVCSNCQKAIPSRSLSLHTVQCLRNNSRCADCQHVIPTRYLAKHRRLHHAAVTCPGCGERVEAALIGKHRRDLCSTRLVECAYCPLLLTAAERGEHSAEDGLFISKCRECGEAMQRKLIRRHLRLKHGRDERSVTWRDFF